MGRLLLAAAMLCIRLAVPALAMPVVVPDPLAAFVLQSICHAGASEDETPASEGQPTRHDCLICPACHLVSHAVLPFPENPVLPHAPAALIGLASPPPAATGPPVRKRVSAHPTGPPSFSA